MMDIKRKEAWKKCLLLWEAMSVRPEEPMGNLTQFKNNILRGLGLTVTDLDHGCPFCHEYLKGGSCMGCPISKDKDEEAYACENYTPYNDYMNEALNSYGSRSHDPELATDFYKYLIQLAKREGYEPDFALRFW